MAWSERAWEIALAALAALGAAVIVGCASRGASSIGGEKPQREVYLSQSGFDADLTTPDGIKVKTNGQYKTADAREGAALAIDRYWAEVLKCTQQIVPPGDVRFNQTVLPEFPHHLSIEIADDWQIVEGPVTHRKQQGFPSASSPGKWVTATREEDALYVKVVPELNGLSRQMAGEVNLWLSGNTNLQSTDLSNVCAKLPCIRFKYDNFPSQAWDDCVD